MLPAELRALLDQIDECERRAEQLVAGVDDAALNQTPPSGGWSVAQCIQHLTLMNDFYLRGWRESVDELRGRGGRMFNGLRPTPIGRWFARSMEPPVKMKAKAIGAVTPPSTIPRAGLVEAYKASHDVYRGLVEAAAHVDVNRVVRPNAIVPAVKMRLATVLLIIPAHDRRHLWQAERAARHAASRSS
jgi:hypothetical protein